MTTGNVRRVPNAKERKHKGGWGLYYHVDYVGAPRNSKMLNVTPVQNPWEQLTLAYENGIDRLWILNVGDLKPMEYPISQFMDMAWNPRKYDVNNITRHTRDWCAQQFGESQADEACPHSEPHLQVQRPLHPRDAQQEHLQSGKR